MYYLYFLLLLVPCLILSAWAQAKVSTTYSTYDKVPNKSRMTGYDTAVRLLGRHGVTDISVNRVNGKLTDHYNPTKKQVNLSMSTYGSASVAAVAVAAHEIGHVMQKKENYFPYLVRKALVPITNFGSRIALPLIVVGVLLDIFLWAAAGKPYGTWMMYIGIALYGLSTLFMLVTLPVEFNASRRARKMLVSEGILTKEEIPAVKKVLSAAAMTYVASLLVSLVYFLRFLFVVLSFARRNN
ncbi:MAG: zinc metallopeptidase [Clostridiales bacterium]|nr:zinc metallopeptidase [Clostridiales bacterium]